MSNPKRPPEAFIGATLFEVGIGYVVVSRFRSAGTVEAGVFLVDVYCLGVKNAFFTRLHESEYESHLLDRIFANEGREPIEPSCARKLVEDAVKYASNLGFAPHSDYKQACRVLGGISSEACARSFTFGKDSKPFYVQGPNDSDAVAQRVLNLLHARCGEGNYHYIVSVGSDTGEV